MWLRLKFSVFGREICSLEVDEDPGEFPEIEGEEYEDEEEEEEESYEETCWGDEVLRWGEPCNFERVL